MPNPSDAWDTLAHGLEPFPAQTVRRLDEHDVRLRALEDWRLELKTLTRVVTAILGTSILSLVLSAIGVWITAHHP